MVTSNVATILFLCFALGHGEVFETKAIDGNSGLYFEESDRIYFYTDEWKIVSNVNLTTYTNEFNDNKNNFELIMTSCEELKFIEIAKNSSKNGSEGCGPILYQLSSLMADIEDNHSNWFVKDARRKRSVVSESFLENWPEDQVFISDEFKKMEIRMSKTSTVAAKQTTFISSSHSIARHDEAQMSFNGYLSNQLSNVSSTLVSAKSGAFNVMRFFQLKTTLQELITYQMHILTSFSSKQKQLLNIVSLVGQKNPKIPILLPSSILRGELHGIRNIINERGLDLPMSLTSEKLLSFYHFSSTEVTMSNDQIFVTFQIPLISKHSNNHFSLFKVSSLFYKIRDDLYFFVVPSHEFIAVDTHKERYTTLSVDDLDNCYNANNMTSIICKQTLPVKNILSSNECEINMLLKRTFLSTCNSRLIRHNAEVFIKALKPNSWLVSFPKQTKTRYMCEGKPTQESFVETNTTILLTIHSYCKLVTDNVLITGQNVFPKSKIYQHTNMNFRDTTTYDKIILSDLFITKVITLNQNTSQVINFSENDKLLLISYSKNDVEIKCSNFAKIVLFSMIAVFGLLIICICDLIKVLSNRKRKYTKVETISKDMSVKLNEVTFKNLSASTEASAPLKSAK